MRHKLRNMYEVGHRWANPEGPDDYAEAGNVSFLRGLYYSYSTPVANRVVTDSGTVGLFAVDYRHYSVTTATHMRVADECFHGVDSFDVPTIDPRNDSDHKDNFDYLVEQVTELKTAIEEKPQYARISDLTQLTQAWTLAIVYAGYFGIEYGDPPYTGRWLEDRKHDIESRELVKRASDRRREAEHEAATAKAEQTTIIERELAEQAFARRRFWLKFIPWPGLGDRYTLIKTRDLESLRSSQTYGQSPKKLAECIAAWRRLEGRSYLYGIDNRTSALLRLNEERNIIETSGSAYVPVSVAPKIWKLVTACRDSGKSWEHDHTRGGVKVGSYRLDSVDSTGAIKLGCHGIQYDELRRMAIELGLAKPTLLERLAGTLGRVQS